MSTWKRLEAVPHYILIRVLADGIRDKHPGRVETPPDNRIDSCLVDAGQVWATAGQEIRPGFAKE